MRKSAILWLLIFTATVLVTWRAAQSEPAKDEDAELYRLFVDALEHVDRSYVKEVNRRELIESAIHGMLGELDPYSNFIPEKEYEQFNRQTTGKFGGVGIQIDGKNKTEPFLNVISPIVGTPAYEAGILAGDRILAVDGKSLEGMSQQEVVEALTGEPGSNVTVSVQRKPYDKEPFDVVLTRGEINIESVTGDKHKPDDSWDYYVDQDAKIAYIRVASFMQQTSGQLKQVLAQLEKDGVKGLVLDLRYNPGGLLSSAIEVCDFFIKEGKIVSTKGRNTQDKAYSASKDAILDGVPIAVLINGGSASASEIVSACLQDHHRAVIVGERSFGKGSVQNVIPLDSGKSALKLTTAGYLRPSGKNIHRFKESKDADEWGVTPDEGYLVEQSREDRETYFLWRTQRDRPFGKNANPEDPAGNTSNESPKADEKSNVAGPDEPKSDNTNEEKSETKEATDEDEKAKQKERVANFKDAQLEKALEYLRGQIQSQAQKAA